ncbi:MAG: single-stranded DNA-binding protein [Clostridia bacterium]
MENYIQYNVVKLGGKIVTDLEYSHEVFDEKFYKFSLEIKRLSDQTDILPIIISEKLIDDEFAVNKKCVVDGQYRSYNLIENEKSKLILSVFTRNIEYTEDDIDQLNEIYLEGFICKKPIYRKTPLGREISDILIAVNRTYKKSDYIPCILWGRNAKFSETVEVGSRVKLIGRIQSRVYEKNIEGNIIKHVAYEISVSKFGLVEENKDIETNDRTDKKYSEGVE